MFLPSPASQLTPLVSLGRRQTQFQTGYPLWKFLLFAAGRSTEYVQHLYGSFFLEIHVVPIDNTEALYVSWPATIGLMITSRKRNNFLIYWLSVHYRTNCLKRYRVCATILMVGFFLQIHLMPIEDTESLFVFWDATRGLMISIRKITNCLLLQ